LATRHHENDAEQDRDARCEQLRQAEHRSAGDPFHSATCLKRARQIGAARVIATVACDIPAEIEMRVNQQRRLSICAQARQRRGA
jgi:hypothetical protein